MEFESGEALAQVGTPFEGGRDLSIGAHIHAVCVGGPADLGVQTATARTSRGPVVGPPRSVRVSRLRPCGPAPQARPAPGAAPERSRKGRGAGRGAAGLRGPRGAAALCPPRPWRGLRAAWAASASGRRPRTTRSCRSPSARARPAAPRRRPPRPSSSPARPSAGASGCCAVPGPGKCGFEDRAAPRAPRISLPSWGPRKVTRGCPGDTRSRWQSAPQERPATPLPSCGQAGCLCARCARVCALWFYPISGVRSPSVGQPLKRGWRRVGRWERARDRPGLGGVGGWMLRALAPWGPLVRGEPCPLRARWPAAWGAWE